MKFVIEFARLIIKGMLLIIAVVSLPSLPGISESRGSKFNSGNKFPVNDNIPCGELRSIPPPKPRLASPPSAANDVISNAIKYFKSISNKLI